MSIGTNIKKRRYELKMSQQDLADTLGYRTRSTIAKIESGENDISQKKLARFAAALDTTVEALISGNHSYSNMVSPAPSAITTSSDLHSPHHTVAIILAGGKSSRNRQNIPNQFINIHSKPMLVYSMDAYQSHPAVDDIYIVCLKGWEDIVRAYVRQYQFTKVRGLISGGNSGINSLKNAVDQLSDHYAPEDIIIVQEATRPMVNVETISKLLKACAETGSAAISHTMNEYVQFFVSDAFSAEAEPAASTASTSQCQTEKRHVQYVDRNSIVALQSPEAHRLSHLLDVFETAKKQQHSLTESCCTMLMYHLGYDINFIEGGLNNIKIVHEEDLKMFSALVK